MDEGNHQPELTISEFSVDARPFIDHGWGAAYGFRPTTKYELIVSERWPAGANVVSVARRSLSKPSHSSPQNSRDEYDVEQR